MLLRTYIGLFALCACAAIAQANSGHTVRVSATVLPRLELRELHHPRTLVVTERDIARGFVEDDEMARIYVSSNCSYRVMVRVVGAEVERADATLLGRTVDETGGTVFPASRGGVVAAVRYRFKLNATARAGTFAWPAELVFEPSAT
jgi:hypothetical protein